MSLVVYMLSPPIPFPNFPRVFCSGWLLESRESFWIFLNDLARLASKSGHCIPCRNTSGLVMTAERKQSRLPAAHAKCLKGFANMLQVDTLYSIPCSIHIYIYIHIHTLRISKALAKCIQIYPNLSNTDSPRSKPGTVVDGQALGVLASCHDVEQSKTSKPRRPLHLRQTWHARIYMDLRHRTATKIANRTNMIWQ